MDNIEKIQIYVDAIKNEESPTGILIRNSKGVWGEFPEKDFVISVALEKRNEAIGYVSTSIDPTVSTIDRQEFNPFFIELDFFSTISRNRIVDSNQLGATHIAFIREKRPDVDAAFSTDSEIREWFDDYGQNELPWNPGTSNEVTLDTLDKVQINLQNIVSKASLYPIDINN